VLSGEEVKLIEHDVIWYGILLWPVQVIHRACVPSQSVCPHLACSLMGRQGWWLTE